MKKRHIFLPVLFLVSGCASLVFETADVTFSEAFFASDFSTLAAPTAEEANGVVLRLKAPEDGMCSYNEHSLLFARTKENRGLKFEFDMVRTERFLPGAQQNTFLIESETIISGDGGKVSEKMETTDQGGIVRFVEGKHKSKIGSFDVHDMKRTPVFPEGAVRIGDTWTHEEQMRLSIKSFWVKQKEPDTHTLKTVSELKGFIEKLGRRVAVIYSKTEENGENALSVLFRNVEITTRSEIEEIVYFDYANGVIVEKVTNTKSHTVAPDAGLSDEGQSQLVSRLTEC